MSQPRRFLAEPGSNGCSPTMTSLGDKGASGRDVLLAANEDAARFYRDQLLSSTSSGPSTYLTQRGFGTLLDETPWTIGYAPAGWTSLLEHLSQQGYTSAALLAAGLACRTRRNTLVDRFHDRITFGIRNPEGELEWVDVNRVLELPLWEGDRHFLPLLFDPNGRPFHGVMPYRDGKPLSWTYSLL